MSGPDRVEFTVAGEAAPKGSRIPGRRKNGSIYTRPASKREKPWAEAIRQAARATGVRLLEPPYCVEVWFGLRRPAKPSYPWPTRSDADKLLRLVQDALTIAGVIVDDRHVVEIRVHKAFVDIPATRIAVHSLRATSQDEQDAPAFAAPSPA